MNGIEALRQFKSLNPIILVIMITAYEDVDTVISAMKLGADDYVIKPLHMDALEVTLRNALDSIRLKKEIQQLEDLWFALQQEITESGKVVSYPARVTSGDGGGRQTQVTRVGPFNATANGRVLRYLPESGWLQELPRQPAGRYRRMALALENGSSGMLPMVVDPSRGAALALLVQVPDLVERVQQPFLVQAL